MRSTESNEQGTNPEAVRGSSVRLRRARTWVAATTVLAAVVGGGAAAFATSGSGVSVPFMTAATFPADLDVKFKVAGHHGVTVTGVKGPGKTIVQQLIVERGGHTGWHSHGGPVLVVVKTGTLTLYSGDDPSCHGSEYTAGQAFVDPGMGHAHIARNEGSNPVEVWVTYLLPADAQPRLDVADPGNCSF